MWDRNTYKSIFIIFSVLILVTGLRIVWTSYLTIFDEKEVPSITTGVLDLRGWEFSDNKTMRLDGEWGFYEGDLLEIPNEQDPQLTTVPMNWQNKISNQEQEVNVGTYHLSILVDEDDLTPLSLRINELQYASAIYVNGELVGKGGQPSREKERYRADEVPYSVELISENGRIDVMIQVASDANSGGINKSIRFGSSQSILKRVQFSELLQLSLSLVIIIYGAFFIILFLLGIRSRELLYFMLTAFFGILSILTVDDVLLSMLIPLNYIWKIKIAGVAYAGGAVYSLLMFNQLFQGYVSKRTIHLFAVITGVYVSFILLAPIGLVMLLRYILAVVIIVSAGISAKILWKAIQDKRDVMFLLLSCLLVLSNILWALVQNRLPKYYLFYPFDLILSMFMYAAFWFKRYFRMTEKTQQLNVQLQKEHQKKDEFLVSTSHELRNPLHGIINMTQTMLQDKHEGLSKVQEEQLGLVQHVGHHLSMLVEDLSDITRLRENMITLKWQKVSIHSVVIGVFDMMRPSLEDKPISFQLEIEEDFPYIWGDEQRITQIMFNLVHNAMKFTESGTISVAGKVTGECATIQVKDTGIGISEKERKGIFGMYEQGNTRKEINVEGLGIGLNVCQNLVELHGGMITVDSEVEEGSAFTFTLPINKGSTDEEQELPNMEQDMPKVTPVMEEVASTLENSSEIPIKSNASTLLIIDDDPINLKVMKHLLETEHYSVTTAIGAEQALAILEETQIDLVISDVMMPKVSGYALTRQIRKQYSLVELPILLLTARAKSQDIFAGFQAGANDYITKPVDALELKARVQALTNVKVALDEHVRMEGAWLQSQIRPHFLFNTLNSVAALGLSNMTKMQELLMEFSNYLRLSIDFKNTDPLVTLEHELKLVASYLYIEKVRFDGRLKIVWEIDPNVSIYVPPLSIQPLVENAVKHGVLKQGQGGTITIKVKQKELYDEVFVYDNGVGMSAEKISGLFIRPEDDGVGIPNTRVGLRNINQRLKQLYKGKLIVESELGKGTTIGYRIPRTSRENRE